MFLDEDLRNQHEDDTQKKRAGLVAGEQPRLGRVFQVIGFRHLDFGGCLVQCFYRRQDMLNICSDERMVLHLKSRGWQDLPSFSQG